MILIGWNFSSIRSARQAWEPPRHLGRGRSTVPKYNSAENENVFNSAENWWFSALLNKKIYVQHSCTSALFSDLLRAAQQFRGTTMSKIIFLFNSAENHQLSALLNSFSFSALLYFGTVVLSPWDVSSWWPLGRLKKVRTHRAAFPASRKNWKFLVKVISNKTKID